MISAVRQQSAVNWAKCLAGDVVKEEGPFFCPSCGSQVVVKKGSRVIHHFAHKPPITCEYGTGESEEHRRCKMEIYDALLRSPQVSECEVERNLREVIPDVSCRINGVPVAIEVQLSNLTIEKIIRRTRWYAYKGIYVLWLPQVSRLSDWNYGGAKRYAPKEWEKWLHSLYYGRVFYWDKGCSVHAISFDHYMLYKEEFKEHLGYSYKSKRYREPYCDAVGLNIAENFMPVDRPEFIGGHIKVPPCRIYTINDASIR